MCKLNITAKIGSGFSYYGCVRYPSGLMLCLARLVMNVFQLTLNYSSGSLCLSSLRHWLAAASVRERIEKEMPIILEAQEAAAQEDPESEEIFPDNLSNLEDTIKLPDIEVVVLTSSTAFEMLKENSTLFIRPSPVARALYKCGRCHIHCLLLSRSCML